jgi:hypothetical protein
LAIFRLVALAISALRACSLVYVGCITAGVCLRKMRIPHSESHIVVCLSVLGFDRYIEDPLRQTLNATSFMSSGFLRVRDRRQTPKPTYGNLLTPRASLGLSPSLPSPLTFTLTSLPSTPTPTPTTNHPNRPTIQPVNDVLRHP